ncbi:TRAP transporter small permease subunit [Cognatishimia sp. MH4019]|uniref:TRAP transporter small permease subunit n=1 Tax=Cognatishimia sp. MH4019 TaxID=2854030 RepID=UPI001CD2694A|nr:TRAP transporter small permease subunit [Cognatishimia sp. MH4019]
MDGIVWFFQNIAMAFYNFVYAITHPGLWLDWSNNEALMRFIYYGGSVEFFFVVFTTFLVFTAIGIWRNSFLWGCVRALEGMANTIGRVAAWAGLLMVLQQIMIVFMQRIFSASEISIGFGKALTFDVSWWSEELKLYNALVVTLCCTYTFVQGGHVRVDLVYSAVSHRAKRLIDMVGSLIFMAPVALITWMYGWYFLWRHLVVPNPSASDTLERLLAKSRALRWNVETIGFSPNGFNAYFLFKILLVTFAALVFLQAVAFFWRSYLEWKEGEESAGKYLDKDKLGDEDAELVANIH